MAKSVLSRAIRLAVAAHDGQEDPLGEPYILHPMRVMLSLPEADHDLRAVAILHDAVERGRLTPGAMRRAKIPAQIVRAVMLLTHDKAKLGYAEYVIKLSANALARAVKLADLADNAALRYVTFRAGKLKKDRKRVVRYAASFKLLTGQMTRKQYQKAMNGAE